MAVIGRRDRRWPRVLVALGIVTASLAFGSASGDTERQDVDRSRSSDERLVVLGDAGGLLQPGGPARAIDLTISNPFPFPVTLTSVEIEIDRTTSRASCDGRTNLVVARRFTGIAVVPARSTRTLSSLAPNVRPAQWPAVRMPDLPVNQDACRRARFTLRYTARFSK